MFCSPARNQTSYKSIAVAATANGHDVVAFSNIDVNIGKQLNIMLTEFGVPADHIVSDPLMAGIVLGGIRLFRDGTELNSRSSGG